MRIVFCSTRNSHPSHASRAITPLRFSVWNQSSTSIDSAAWPAPGLCVLAPATAVLSQQPVPAAAKHPYVRSTRESEIAGRTHIERLRLSALCPEVAQYTYEESRTLALCS